MPQVSHTILSWAREAAGLSLEEAAHKLQIKDSARSTAVQKILSYEEGTKEPSRAMLLKFAKTYRRPLLTFYLKEPPKTGDRGEDFRTLPDGFDARENVYVDTLIRDIKARQSTLKDALIDEDEAEKIDFVGSQRLSDGIEATVKNIYQFLTIDIDEYRRQITSENAFKYLRKKIEDAGVFVVLMGNLGSHHTDIPVQVFRGFALSDDIAPFIVINDKDAKSAWSFTLVHELAHLALGATGVSGTQSELAIEKFCNDIASEFFLPAAEFQSFVPPADDFEMMCEEITGYAKAINVSSSHISYRLFKRGDIAKETWYQLRDFYHEAWKHQQRLLKKKQKSNNGGPDYYVLRKRSLGGGLLGVVDRFIQSGTISTTKAAMLLGVRPIKVHRLFE